MCKKRAYGKMLGTSFTGMNSLVEVVNEQYAQEAENQTANVTNAVSDDVANAVSDDTVPVHTVPDSMVEFSHAMWCVMIADFPGFFTNEQRSSHTLEELCNSRRLLAK